MTFGSRRPGFGGPTRDWWQRLTAAERRARRELERRARERDRERQRETYRRNQAQMELPL